MSLNLNSMTVEIVKVLANSGFYFPLYSHQSVDSVFKSETCIRNATEDDVDSLLEIEKNAWEFYVLIEL